MKEKLELRMYGLVPYNISEIQKAIQFGHAVVEYGLEHFHEDRYLDWAKYWKTFIILNGGTSNHSLNRYHHSDDEFQGSMESSLATLMSEGIDIATFYEPDLNDMLSAIVFIVDERVFNKKGYPDFGDWIMESHYSYLSDNMINSSKIERMRLDGHFERGTERERRLYSEWTDLVGGKKNVFLRDYLKNFRLA
jgi:hypothetical protein